MQIRMTVHRSKLCKHCRLAHRHQPLVHQFLAIHTGPRAAAKADRRMHFGSLEIDQLNRSFDAQLKAGVQRFEAGQSRHQPLGQE
jgi:hypothetical protein